MRERAEPCAVDDPKFYALMAGRGVQVRNGLAAGGRWIRTLGPLKERHRFSSVPFDVTLPLPQEGMRVRLLPPALRRKRIGFSRLPSR